MFEKKVTVEQKKQAEKEAKVIKKLEKKEQKNKSDSKALSIVKTIMIPAVFAAIVVCAIYIAMENKAQDLSNKTGVVFLKEDIKVNTFITKDAIDNYFEVKSIDQTAVPANAYKSLSDLPKDGFYVERNMEASQMVLKSDVSEKDAIMDKYKNGYQVTSFAADSFDGGVNGSLRRGDIVDVFNKKEETINEYMERAVQWVRSIKQQKALEDGRNLSEELPIYEQKEVLDYVYTLAIDEISDTKIHYNKDKAKKTLTDLQKQFSEAELAGNNVINFLMGQWELLKKLYLK